MKGIKYLILTMALASCQAQKTNRMDIPQTDSRPENFELGKIAANPSGAYMQTVENPQASKAKAAAVDKVAYVSSDEYTYAEWDSEKKLLVRYTRGVGGNGEIDGYDYSQNPLFGIYKLFYANGKLQEKGVYCWFGFKTGKWYTFDVKGKLVNTTDYSEGYTFDEKDIFAFCDKNNISLEKKEDGPRTIIGKSENEQGKRIWYITYHDVEKSVVVVYHLDAADGSVLKRWEEPLPGFEENVRH